MDSPRIVYESKLQVFGNKGYLTSPNKTENKSPFFFSFKKTLGALTHTLADLVFAVIS
jgi:hypothetical protein